MKKKTPRSPSKSEFRCIGGLINRFLPVWCPISHSIWPLLFPHQLSGGSGTRLSIRRQDPNNYSDTEMRALSAQAVRGWIRIQVCSSKNCTSLIIVFQQGKATTAKRHQGLNETVDFALGKYFNRTSYLCLSLWPPGAWQCWPEWSILCPNWSTQQPIRNILAPLSTHICKCSFVLK